MSTETGRLDGTDGTAEPARLDGSGAYRLNPAVALRPEPFGALAYHFGSRRLSFLKEPLLVEVVRRLAEFDTVEHALDGCGVPPERRRAYLDALAALVRADMIQAA